MGCLLRLTIVAISHMASTSSISFSMGRLYPKMTDQLL